MTAVEKAREMIRQAMRVRGNQTPWPETLKPSPELLKLVDAPTAQKLYKDVLAELEAASEIKFKTKNQLPPKTDSP